MQPLLFVGLAFTFALIWGFGVSHIQHTRMRAKTSLLLILAVTILCFALIGSFIFLAFADTFGLYSR